MNTKMALWREGSGECCCCAFRYLTVTGSRDICSWKPILVPDGPVHREPVALVCVCVWWSWYFILFWRQLPRAGLDDGAEIVVCARAPRHRHICLWCCWRSVEFMCQALVFEAYTNPPHRLMTRTWRWHFYENGLLLLFLSSFFRWSPFVCVCFCGRNKR